jgi:RNA polymerase sigma-70 factor (ECF subfamily)
VNKRVQQASVPSDHATSARDRDGAAEARDGAAGGGVGSAGSRDDDRRLVEAARRGDRGAFRTLFDRYHRRAYGLALGVVRNPDDALDVVQDAFIKAHRYLDKFEGSSSFYTWLYRIVMNLAIDHLRKHRRVKAVDFTDAQLADGPQGGVGEESLLPKILGENPGRSLLDKEIRKRIEAALAELSDNHRAVLVMRELEGLSYEEMAEVMECSKGTIMSRLFHARRNMQKRLIDLVDNPSAELLADLGETVPADDSSTPSPAARRSKVPRGDAS